MTDPLREAEAYTIRSFVQRAADDGYLSGRVLDYGCGKQPYRDIVEAAGGEYVGFDRADLPANVSGEDVGEPYESSVFRDWDTVLCTQVLQYVRDVRETIQDLHVAVVGRVNQYPPGHLVLTYPTNWPEVEQEDLHRFTKAGMERLLTEAGFTIVRHEWRHGFHYEGVSFAAGYGVIASA